MTYGGNITFGRNMTFGSNMTFDRNMTFGKNLTSCGNMTFDENMTSCRNMVFGGNLTAIENMTFVGDTTSDGNMASRNVVYANLINAVNGSFFNDCGEAGFPWKIRIILGKSDRKVTGSAKLYVLANRNYFLYSSFNLLSLTLQCQHLACPDFNIC